MSRTLGSTVCKVLRTPKNVFGLVRQYLTDKLPSHDPEELVTLADLTSIPLPTSTNVPTPPAKKKSNPFFPYLNKNSFRLGQWFWNGSVQKSQKDFKELVDIVGDVDFQSSDVRETKWGKINATLGNGVESRTDDTEDGEWVDMDAGWKKTRIKISVPFSKRMANPGVHEYADVDLHHRSLVEVIKEHISDPHTSAQFHLEPYELLWQPHKRQKEVKLHGEIYMSEAFIEAHRDLQQSPCEPDCDLERVVVALMFWSDSTHLTSFRNAHLWLCYLFLGNESKYRQCKPSCNLCSHVAYFQSVRPQTFIHM